MGFAEMAEEWEKKLTASFVHRSVNHEGDTEVLDFVAPPWDEFFGQLMSELDEMQHTLLDALREAARLQAGSAEN